MESEADMADSTTDPIDPPPPSPATPDPAPSPNTDLKSEVDKWKALARKHEAQSKANADKAKRLDDIEKANASDLDKAVAKAKDEARAEVARTFGEKLVRGVMKAQLEQTMKPADAAALLDDINLAKFVGQDGEVDEEAVSKAIARLAPRGNVDLGQGGRGDGPSLDQQIADATKRGDTKLAISLTNQKLLLAANR